MLHLDNYRILHRSVEFRVHFAIIQSFIISFLNAAKTAAQLVSAADLLPASSIIKEQHNFLKIPFQNNLNFFLGVNWLHKY